MKLFEPLASDFEEELLDHLAADAQLVPYQPGMVLPGQVAPLPPEFTDGSSADPRARPPTRGPGQR